MAECAAAGVARQALLLRIDHLPPALSRPHHRRLAEAALAPLLRAPRAELFHLSGPRLVVVWRGDAEAALLDAVDALDHLLADAPVAAPTLHELVYLFDLPEGGDLLLQALANAPGDEAPRPDNDPPLDPASLLLLESALAQANLARFARREAVWHMTAHAASLAWKSARCPWPSCRRSCCRSATCRATHGCIADSPARWIGACSPCWPGRTNCAVPDRSRWT